jgi:tetratricopeptide (TPR) repeat protein
MFIWIASFLLLAAVVTVAVIFLKHWKEIRLLDPETIRAELERKTRERIVKQRFDRRVANAVVPMRRVGRAVLDKLLNTYHQVEDRLARAAHISPYVGAHTEEELPEDVQRLLNEARSFARDEMWTEAEHSFLEVLKHDERQLDAYRGLAAIYLAQKQYAQAKETFQFLERIHGANDACYAGLAEIAESEGNLRLTERMRKLAIEKNPKHAVRHAELAQFYQAHGSPDYAYAEARKAADLEPDSPSFLELSLEAAILVRDRNEAERRYDRWRLLTNDRQKLQTYRDKIDALTSKK